MVMTEVGSTGAAYTTQRGGQMGSPACVLREKGGGEIQGCRGDGGEWQRCSLKARVEGEGVTDPKEEPV